MPALTTNRRSYVQPLGRTRSGACRKAIDPCPPNGPRSPVTRFATVAAGARFTFLGHVDVPNEAFSVSVTSAAGIDIVAEMAMYDPGREIAHRTVGVTGASSGWALGEGFTGFGWETFISVGNSGASDATVTATFNIDGEPPIQRTIIVPAGSRGTFIAHDIVTGVGAGKAFGVQVTSSHPVVVQEVLIDPATGASRATSSMATPDTRARWSFGAGSSAPGVVTFLTVANLTIGLTANVTATYYFADGTLPVSQSIQIPPESRGTFSSASGVPAGKDFGVVITSDLAVVAQQAVYDEPRVRAFSSGGMSDP